MRIFFVITLGAMVKFILTLVIIAAVISGAMFVSGAFKAMEWKRRRRDE
jgi:hypothetical protein